MYNLVYMHINSVIIKEQHNPNLSTGHDGIDPKLIISCSGYKIVPVSSVISKVWYKRCFPITLSMHTQKNIINFTNYINKRKHVATQFFYCLKQHNSLYVNYTGFR